MKCQKCKNNFPEKELELSHDIPKYLGGTDKDGRHWLCKDCHDNYEYYILSSIYKAFFGRNVKKCIDRRDYIPLMNQIKEQRDDIKERYFFFAQKLKEEWENGSD